MEISCVNAKRSTIDEPCCEPVSLVRARLTLTLTLFLKKNKKTSEIKLLLITGRKIGHRRKERECIFPCSEATSDDLVLLFHWRSCYLVAVLFSTRFHLPFLSFFFFGLFSDKHSHPLVFQTSPHENARKALECGP